MILILMSSYFLLGKVNAVCFPGEPPEKCRDSMTSSSSLVTRSSVMVGRKCFASSGYFGTCRPVKDCSNSDYSFSRTCGWQLTCCKSFQVQPDRSRIIFGGQVSRPSRPTSTRPQRKPDVRRQFPGCGKPATQFVFGGTVARKGALPFMVSFIEVYRSGAFSNFCGGVLITQRHVLTAAHCFANIPRSDYEKGRIDVRLGTNDLSEEEDASTRVDIDSVRIHPEYREKGEGVINPVNDVAIVKLSRNVTSAQVVPVCLPGRKRGTQALVAGWGRTTRDPSGDSVTKLRFAYVKEFPRAVCQKKYNEHVFANVIISADMLCAGNAAADTCSGDSGGPLLWSENRRWTVGGIVSFGPSSCGNVIPGVYARVEDYLPWIYDNLDNYL